MGAAGASMMTWHGFEGDSNGPNASNDNSDDIQGCRMVIRQLTLETLREARMTCWEPCPSYQATARSQHAGGGVQVVMVDGSVHWISDDVNTTGVFGGCCSVWDRLIGSQDGFPVELE
jgi:prepilin-type processing-associated H-X9-DG protein